MVTRCSPSKDETLVIRMKVVYGCLFMKIPFLTSNDLNPGFVGDRNTLWTKSINDTFKWKYLACLGVILSWAINTRIIFIFIDLFWRQSVEYLYILNLRSSWIIINWWTNRLSERNLSKDSQPTLHNSFHLENLQIS